MTRFKLFGDFAHRYDLHTPAQHYQHDHAFVLAEFAGLPGRRILDVGCGTGVFVEKALAAGFDAYGFDVAPEMIAQAADKVGEKRVWTQPMEALSVEDAFDGICALSWVINYAADGTAVAAVLERLLRALVPGGRLVLQCAHAPNMESRVFEDREAGPGGQADDVVLLFQFLPLGPDRAQARYVFVGKSLGELIWEEHPLGVANAETLAALAATVGFTDVRVFGSWRREPLGKAISAWVVAERRP